MSDHPICHVEIPAIDPATASTFYADVFERNLYGKLC